MFQLVCGASWCPEITRPRERPREATLPWQQGGRSARAHPGTAAHRMLCTWSDGCRNLLPADAGENILVWFSWVKFLPAYTIAIKNTYLDVIILVLLKRMIQLKSFSLVPWYFYRHLDYIWRWIVVFGRITEARTLFFYWGFLIVSCFLQNKKFWGILKKMKQLQFRTIFFILFQ